MVHSKIYISLFCSPAKDYISAPMGALDLLSNLVALSITLQPYVPNSIGYTAVIYDIICYR